MMKMVFEIETKKPSVDWSAKKLGELLQSEQAWLCPLTIKKLCTKEINEVCKDCIHYDDDENYIGSCQGEIEDCTSWQNEEVEC